MKKQTNKRGFTLLEIIITLVICAAIFAGALPLIFTAVTNNRSARLKLNAYQAAQREMETLRGQPITTLSNHTFITSDIPGGVGTITVNRNINSVNQTDIALVISRVTWSFHNRDEQVQLSTYMYGE